MKLLVMGLLMAGLTGCGLQDQVNELKNNTNKDSDRIDSIESRVSALEAQMATAKAELFALAAQQSATQSQLNIDIATLQSLGASTDAQVVALQTDLQNAINAAGSLLNSLQGQINLQQIQINSSLVQIAVLQGYKNIVAIIDPCGTQGNYNEVFLKLSNDQMLASFSDNASGQNTRFTVLTDGNFVTTDGTHCSFTVSGSGTVISNEHN
jgi:hypothetical protein